MIDTEFFKPKFHLPAISLYDSAKGSNDSSPIGHGQHLLECNSWDGSQIKNLLKDKRKERKIGYMKKLYARSDPLQIDPILIPSSPSKNNSRQTKSCDAKFASMKETEMKKYLTKQAKNKRKELL